VETTNHRNWLSMRVRFGLFWWLVEVAWQR
jgi:hypothetical protein